MPPSLIRLYLTLCLVVLTSAQTTKPPPSPCPDVFRYVYEPTSASWYGVITIVPPARFSDVQLAVRLDLPYYRPDAGVGRIEILGGNNQVQQISNKAARGERQKLEYLVIFPPFPQIPKVAGVTFNLKNFCPRKQTYSDTRGTIELKYTLKSGLQIPISHGNEFSVFTQQTTQQPTYIPNQPDVDQHVVNSVAPGSPLPNTDSSIEVIIVQVDNTKHPGTDSIHFPVDSYNNAQSSRPNSSGQFPHQGQTNLGSSRPSSGDSYGGQSAHQGQTNLGSSRPSSGDSYGGQSANQGQTNLGSSRPSTGSSFVGQFPQTSHTISGGSKPSSGGSQFPLEGDINLEGFTNSVGGQNIEERIVQLLSAISHGEAVASSKIVHLLERLLVLSKKRYELELERLRIERERLKLESG